MSHDIDLILSRQDLARLQTVADDMSASHHLGGTKWRGSWRSVHLDLYVPYESRLGANLQLRAETLQVLSEVVDGYRVLTAPAHVATKVAALLDRPDSLPGRKDRQEILALLHEPVTSSTARVIALTSARSPSEVERLVRQAFSFLLEEPELSRQDRSRLRQTEASWQRVLSETVGTGLVRDRSHNHDSGLGLGL